MPRRLMARQLAVEFLEKRFSDGIPLEGSFQSRRFASLLPRDRRLTTELVYGSLRHLARIDYYLQELFGRSLDRVDSAILWILRVAVYQLEFLRVPSYAVVNEAVQLARRRGSSRSGGFVNAVLRNFLRRRPALPVGDAIEALAVRYSHPEWLVERYLRRHGLRKAKLIMEQNNRPPDRFLWVNPYRISRSDFCTRLKSEGISYQIVEELPHCVLVEASSFVQHPLYLAGECCLMDHSSQAVVAQCPLEGKRIVGDFCAAPGGKSFTLAAALDPEARLFCGDHSWSRLQQMATRAALYEVPGLRLFQADLERPAPVAPCFEFILLDVPCSGLGTIRANPDIRWLIGVEDLVPFQELQLRLLKNAFRALRRGGDLFYCTCSTEPEENQEVIETFLKQESNAEGCGSIAFGPVAAGPGADLYLARVRRR